MKHIIEFINIKQHSRYNVLALMLSALSLTGCGDFLEESSQDTDYVSTWNDLEELLLGDGYMPVVTTSPYLASGGNYGMMLHLVGDEISAMTTSGTGAQGEYESYYQMFGPYTWQQRIGQNETYTDYYKENYVWTKVYNAINVANNVLDEASKLPSVSDADRIGQLRVSGEAHFLRGYYYFWLANLYGQPYAPSSASTDLAVPLKTSAMVEDKIFSRNTVAEVYAQVVEDLLMAEQELSQVSSRKSIYRADYVTVQMLLSRVYLYMQQWNKAAEYAQKVIKAHPALQDLNTNTAKLLEKNNTEIIFSMGGDDLPRILNSGYRAMTVSNDLWRSYAQSDLRRTLWYWPQGAFRGVVMRAEGTYADKIPSSNSSYFAQMYNLGHTNSQAPVSTIFAMRSAEAYLNLAEAQACQGNDNEARQTLLTLMRCRYNPSAQELDIESTNGTSLVNLIRQERRRELALQGHRWFDLRRYRVDTVAPSRISITHDYLYFTTHTSSTPADLRRYVLTEDDKSWTLPMPAEVLEYNTGMEGNGNEYRNYTVISQ